MFIFNSRKLDTPEMSQTEVLRIKIYVWKEVFVFCFLTKEHVDHTGRLIQTPIITGLIMTDCSR